MVTGVAWDQSLPVAKLERRAGEELRLPGRQGQGPEPLHLGREPGDLLHELIGGLDGLVHHVLAVAHPNASSVPDGGDHAVPAHEPVGADVELVGGTAVVAVQKHQLRQGVTYLDGVPDPAQAHQVAGVRLA